MAKFRIDTIAALARQMSFTPQDIRLAQLTNAENLLTGIEANKAYPLEFVIFRITGYHPKTSSANSNLLTGLALQHDLGLLIETVSETIDLVTSSLPEPVLTIDDVTEKFNVTSKTIQRWRRKGLPARRFLFPDGKRRVGFLLSSVERFIASHQEQVVRGANFSQVDPAEREEIIRRARRLAGQCRCCQNEIARRIARKLNRSPLTVLHTIRKHDEEHPEHAVFAAAPEPLSDSDRASIVRAFDRGVGLKTLARRACRPRSAIYRIVLEHRIAKLNRKKVKFIDDPLYHQPDAAEVMEELARQDELGATQRLEDSRVPRDLPPYLRELYRTPLLTPARERGLFLKLNFHKYQFVSARRRIDPQLARMRDLNVLESHLRKATEVKNAIVRANLRLVVSVARRHLRPGMNLMELVSDGNITLMRAVDSFDVHKGNRFITYATLALMKGFARSVPAMLSKRKTGVTVDEQTLSRMADPRFSASTDRLLDREQVQSLLQRLDESERAVVRAHFGLGEQSAPATYEQVGHQFGISKQRVRQIERAALAKLRSAAVN